MDELLERIASLESELESERGKASSMDEQVALMEKSYELAAKYMGGQNGGQPSAEQRAEPTTVQKGKKNKALSRRNATGVSTRLSARRRYWTGTPYRRACMGRRA